MDIHDEHHGSESEDEASQPPKDELSPEEQKEQQREVLEVMMNFTNRYEYLRTLTINFRNFALKEKAGKMKPDGESIAKSIEFIQLMKNFFLVEDELGEFKKMRISMMKAHEEENFDELAHLICQMHNLYDMHEESLKAFVLTFGGPEDWDFMQAVDSEDVENMDVLSNSSSSLPSPMDSDDSAASDWEDLEELLFHSGREE